MGSIETAKSICDWIENDELAIFLCYVSKDMNQFEQNAISFFGWSLSYEKDQPKPDWGYVDNFIQTFGNELRKEMSEVFPA